MIREKAKVMETEPLKKGDKRSEIKAQKTFTPLRRKNVYSMLDFAKMCLCVCAIMERENQKAIQIYEQKERVNK